MAYLDRTKSIQMDLEWNATLWIAWCDCIITEQLVDGEEDVAKNKCITTTAEKHKEFSSTYHNRASTRFSIHVLVAQVEDERGSAVKKGQHSNADVKLCWGCMVSCQVGKGGGGLIDFTVRNFIRMVHQPVNIRFSQNNP